MHKLQERRNSRSVAHAVVSMVAVLVVAIAFNLVVEDRVLGQESGRKTTLAQFSDAVLTSETIRNINPARIAGLLGNRPEEIYRFVRDDIRFEAYTGILRGAEGTLLARAGNSYDQAILLKTIFDSIGVPCRLVRGKLPEDKAAKLLQSMSPDSQNSSSLISERDFKALGIDAEAYKKAWSKQLDARDKFLDSIIAGARKDVAALGISSDQPRLGLAASTVRDYLWVQIQSKGVWLDMHPAFPKGEKIEVVPEGIINYIASLPSEFFHWVRVRLIGERLVEGGFQKKTLLDKRLLAAVAAGETISIDLRPETDSDKNKVSLHPAVRIGETILSADPVDFSSSDGSNTLGALTAIWLEVTVLSPMERSRIQTITLAESYPAPLGSESGNGFKPESVSTLSDKELQVRAEMMIATSGVDPRILLRDSALTFRWIGNVRQSIGRGFDVGLHGFPTANPLLSRWNVMLSEIMSRAMPGKRVYMDDPVVAAIVYRPVRQKSGMRLDIIGGLTHFHSASPDALGKDAGLPSVLANRLLQGLLPLHSNARVSISSPSDYKKLSGSILSAEMGKALDQVSRRELQYDLVRGFTVYLAESADHPVWWRMESEGIDPVLRGKGGWSIYLTFDGYSPDFGGIAFGEMERAISESKAGKSASERFERAVSLYFSRYLSPNGFSPMRVLVEAKYGQKLGEMLH